MLSVEPQSTEPHAGGRLAGLSGTRKSIAELHTPVCVNTSELLTWQERGEGRVNDSRERPAPGCLFQTLLTAQRMYTCRMCVKQAGCGAEKTETSRATVVSRRSSLENWLCPRRQWRRRKLSDSHLSVCEESV